MWFYTNTLTLLLIILLALVTLLNTNCNTNCRITLLIILFTTSWCKPLYAPQCPLITRPKLNLIVYKFPLQNQTANLANHLADTIIYRSSCSQMFFKINGLKNFTNFTGTHLCWSLFLNKVSDLKACNFIKKRLQHRCFTEKFAKYSGTTFLQNISAGVSSLELSMYPPDSQTSFNLKRNITVKPFLYKKDQSLLYITSNL